LSWPKVFASRTPSQNRPALPEGLALGELQERPADVVALRVEVLRHRVHATAEVEEVREPDGFRSRSSRAMSSLWMN
jgi:hypothetical protein